MGLLQQLNDFVEWLRIPVNRTKRWGVLLLLISVSTNAIASSQPVTNMTVYTQAATSSSYTGNDGQAYNWGSGNEVVLDTFTTASGTYSPAQIADLVTAHRVDNAVVAGDRCSLFAERNSGNSKQLMPSLECDISAIMSGRVINRGWLDVFNNDSRNNIERVDFIFTGGIQTPSMAADLANTGFIVTEKSGNNPTVIAAITSLDGSNSPATYSPLVKVWPHTNSGESIRYGLTNQRFDFTFLQDGSAPASQDGEPEQIGQSTENMGIAFVTLDDMGISAGQTIYGFSYFSQDIYDAGQTNRVAVGVDPVDYTTFPTDTSGAGNVADADMYGGVAGYFTQAQLLSGNVYKDQDQSQSRSAGDTDLPNITVTLYNDINNSGTLEPTDTVVATTVTDSSGYYGFNVGKNTNYLVQMDESDPDLPTGLSTTSDNPVAVSVGSSDVGGVDFSLFDTPSFSCTSKVDLWFANDESGSVSPTEFVDARDFIYLVSDEFYHSFADGAQGGLVGWAYSAAPKNVIMPLTETFYDQGDTGLASTGTTVDGDGNGVRENYTVKVDTTGGTHLSNATQGVADLVNAGNGRRTGVPQVAVFLTDAPSSQINNVSGNGGGTAWETAAANLRNAGPDGVRIAVVLLAEAAQAYDNNAASRATIDSVIGNDGIVIKTSSYALAADPAESYIQQTVDQICGVASFIEYDFGDAPVTGSAPDGSSTNNYGETSHQITTGVYLGSSEPDEDTANQPTVNADGDDADGSDDEDGITFPTLTQGETSSIVATVVGASGYLQAWIDFDGNGLFDAGEQVATNLQDGGAEDTDGSGDGTITFDVNVPMTAVTNQTYARFRWSTTQDLDTITLASDGEIEDYALSIELGGFPVKGRVFIDTDVDGVNDAGEKGVSDLPVVLLKVESNPANNTCVSARTDAEGNYEFFPVLPGNYQLYEASTETVPTPQNCDVALAKDPAGYRSTTDNALAQFSVVDAEITGKDFGDVKAPTFAPDHSGTILPGNVLFYAHKFTAKSTGTVDFTTADSGGTTAGWSSVIYQDVDCNGLLESAEASATITADLATTADQDICLINKVYAPGGVSAGETFTNIISADFNFNNNALAGTSTLKVTDLTKAAANDPVQGSSRLELRKTVQNITQSSAETATQNQAKPGDILQYRIYYSNTGTGVITDLKINDVVPAFTTINGLPLCDAPLPSSLTNCTPIINGNDIEWVFPASDQLEAGSQGTVSYKVTIE